MSTLELNRPELGQDGERCQDCAAPLAADQRYCLNCGRRRGEPRLPFQTLLGGEGSGAGSQPAPGGPPQRTPRTGLLALAGAAGAALLVGLGVLIGAVAADKEQPIVRASAPPQKAPVVNITNTGGGGAPVEEEFVSDWPEGENGWTVQLETFPNDGTVPVSEVTAAETEATGNGAEEVGSLSSDDFGSLDPGLYIVYSGVFTGKGGKADAQKALKKLKKDFPDAKLIQVKGGATDTGAESSATLGDDELQELQQATGEEQQKKSAQLPDELSLGGKPPPKDNKAPAGGQGGGQVIE